MPIKIADRDKLRQIMRKTYSNAAEFTVSEISGALRKTIEETYGNVRVRGEISGYRGPHASGHAYFALKDDKARLEAVIWRTAMQSLKFPPEEGLEVIASGRLSSYAGSSKYQIIIDSLEPAGAGALMALLEERRKKLAEEGLFDESRKKPLPFMPKIIGVITSPTGAVIRDIIHRIEDRFPLHIVVWPVRVQGESAGAEAAAAIRGFNALPDIARGLAREPAGGGREQEKGAIPRPDLLIIARGGGSLEDLWCFNDEALVRAAAASALPIISAIGHETDWTLLDYAADKRAPTPTGAAEMAVPVKAELTAAIVALYARLGRANRRLLQQNRQNLSALARALPAPDRLPAEPRRRFDDHAARHSRALVQLLQHKRSFFTGLKRQISPYLVRQPLFEKQRQYRHLALRLGGSFAHNILRHAQRLETPAKLIKTLSLTSILERGFALVTDKEGKPVRRAQAVMPGQELSLHFADGIVAAAAIKSREQEAALPQADKIARRKEKLKTDRQKQTVGQGNLF